MGPGVNLNSVLTADMDSVICDGGWGGIRTLGTLRYTRFPGVPNRPLWHPSENEPTSLVSIDRSCNPFITTLHHQSLITSHLRSLRRDPLGNRIQLRLQFGLALI